jgi:hypothetical protein
MGRGVDVELLARAQRVDQRAIPNEHDVGRPFEVAPLALRLRAGPGGVMMHVAGDSALYELRPKGGSDGSSAFRQEALRRSGRPFAARCTSSSRIWPSLWSARPHSNFVASNQAVAVIERQCWPWYDRSGDQPRPLSSGVHSSRRPDYLSRPESRRHACEASGLLLMAGATPQGALGPEFEARACWDRPVPLNQATRGQSIRFEA